MIKLRTSSIRWKLVLVYFILVFIAVMIIGVSLTKQLENYYINSIRKNIVNTVNEGDLTSSFAAYDNLADNKEEIQRYVDNWSLNLGQEIFVVDSDLNIIAASNENAGRNAIDILDCETILMAFAKDEAESFTSIILASTTIPVMNKAFLIENGDGQAIGVLYVRADISSVEDSISEAGIIFIRAMLLALILTVVLGFLIAGSITDPIRDVTQKAEKMSQGDFSQEVSIKSNDEIGQLAEMFNILRIKLNDTLSQISNEKNKLETVLKHMADALIAVDLSGKLIHANQAARAFLNISEEEAQTADYDKLIAGINKDLTLANMYEQCRNEAVSLVFEYNHGFFAVRYDRYKDENDEDIGILMIIQDISERQKLENMQMDFVANVSHELKTPLTTIKSYTETLIEGVGDPEIEKSFLSIIDTEADRMNRLVSEILQLSRMENNQMDWDMKEGNLTAILNAAIMKVEMTAKEKSQQLNRIYDAEERIPAVVDRDKIEQVILNVLSNAIKYTQEGGRIDIDFFRKGKEAVIIIADNGIGIPENEQSRVFERFFRVDKARSRSMGGTGLGLSISKQIVEEHGGRIELESKEKKGTKVTISIPLSVSATRGKRLDD